MKILILSLILVSGAAAQTWGGFYVAASKVSPLSKEFARPIRTDQFTVDAVVIVNLNKKCSLQFQIIQPLGNTNPVLRIGISRRLF